MKRILAFFVFGLGLAALGNAAQADYRTSAKGKEPPSAGDEFRDAVDLSRYRKGNLEWDTQELIASGLTALHEEHQRILLRLDEIQDRLSRLERDSAESK